jgi:TP901 family phage tail tape measure protein
MPRGAYSDAETKAIIEIALEDRDFRSSVKALADYAGTSTASILTAIKGIEKGHADLAKSLEKQQAAQLDAIDEEAAAMQKAFRELEAIKAGRLRQLAEINAAVKKQSDDEIQRAQANATIKGTLKKKESTEIIRIDNDTWKKITVNAKKEQELQKALAVKAAIDEANAIRKIKADLARAALQDHRQYLKEELEARKAAIAASEKVLKEQEVAISERNRRISSSLRVGAGVAGALGQYQAAGALYGAANATGLLGSVGVSTTALAVGGGAAVIGAGLAAAYYQAEKFNVALHDTATLLTELGPGTQEFADGLALVREAALNVSDNLNIGVIDTLKSFKAALSSGIDYRDLEQFATAIGTFSKATGADLEKTTDLFTSFKDNYGLTVNEMGVLSDRLFNVIDVGKVNVEAMIANLGRVLPTATAAGVGVKDLTGAFATLTRTMKPSQATTALTNLIRGISNPSKEAAKEFDRLGIAYGTAAFKGKNFSDVISEIFRKTGGDLTKLGDIFEDQFSVRGAAALTGNLDLLDKNTAAIDKFGTAVLAAGVKQDTLFGKVSKDANEAYNSILRLVNSEGLGRFYDKMKRGFNTAYSPNSSRDASIKDRLADPNTMYADNEADSQLKAMDLSVQKILSQFSEKYINGTSAEVDKLLTAGNLKAIQDFFKSAEESDKYFASLERQRIEKLLSMAGFTPVAYDSALKPKPNTKADKLRSKEVDLRVTDDQLDQLRELRTDVTTSVEDLDNAVAAYANELGKQFIPLQQELDTTKAKITTLQEEFDKETNPGKRNKIREELVYNELLFEEAKKKYALEKENYEKSKAEFKKSEESKIDIAKKALADYENEILKQKTRKEEAANDKKVKDAEATEKKIYGIIKKADDKLRALQNQKDDLLQKQREANVKRTSKYIDEDYEDAKRGAGEVGDAGNSKINKRKLQAAKEDLKRASSGGDYAEYRRALDRLEEAYGNYKQSAIANGANPNRFERNGAESWAKQTEGLVQETKATARAAEKTAIEMENAKDLSRINNDISIAQKQLTGDIALATRGTEHGVAAANSALSRLITEVAGVASPIVSAISNLKLSSPTTPNEPTDKVAPDEKRGTVGTPTSGATDPYGQDTPWNHFLDTGEFDAPSEEQDYGLLRTTSRANASIQHSTQNNSNSSNVNNVNISGVGSGTARLNSLIESALNTYHKEQNIVAVNNKNDTRLTSSYPVTTVNKSVTSRRK